jgi:hypothetical protein
VEATPNGRDWPAAAYDPTQMGVVMVGVCPSWTYECLDLVWRYRWDSDWPDEQCGNGLDDDDDCATDCADTDCASLRCEGGRCAAGACRAVSGD